MRDARSVMTTRIRRLTALVLAMFVLATPAYARVESSLCPSGTVTVFLPAAEGGQVDRIYASVRTLWMDAFDTSLTFQYLPGRGGSYAITAMLDAKDDGCTFAAVQIPTFFFLPLCTNGMYEVADVAPLAVFTSVPNALWVAEDSPFVTVNDLAVHMRARWDAGDTTFTVAGVGSYTDQHLAYLQFQRAAGVKGRYLPVRGSAGAVAAVLDGEAGACWAYALSPDSMPGLRPLAVADAQRSTALPHTPTMRERNILMENVCLFGLAVRSSLPEKTRARYMRGLDSLFSAKEMRQALAQLGAETESPDCLPLVFKAADEYQLIPDNLRR